MKNRSILSFYLFAFALLLSGCGGDPNVEGAKLNINNKEYDKALANLDKAIATNPANIEALETKGYVHYLIGISKRDNVSRIAEFTKMREAYSKAITAGGTADKGQRFIYSAWGSQVNRAISNIRKNEADSTLSAIEVLQNATTLLPDSSFAHALLGRAFYLQTTNNPAAIAPLKMAIDKGYKDEATFDMLARTLINNDRAAEAIPVLEKAQQAFPANKTFEAVIIEAYKLSGQIDKALASYQTAVTADPNNIDARLRYGNLLLQTGSYDQAMAQLEAAYALDGNNDDVLYNLGISYYNKAVGLAKEKDAPNVTTARAQELKREMDALFNKAFPFLEKAREINSSAGKDSENQPICKALFGIYANIGMRDKANQVMSCAGM